ncbi:MAG: hypothetical protein HC880_02795 [Bacteroidia bacterium]|nr:hypothetical protein [Bacteroidia bacterium]
MLAFIRRSQGQSYLVVAPLYLARMNKGRVVPPAEIPWGNTHVILPKNLPDEWIDVLSGYRYQGAGQMYLRDIFREVPLAFYRGG